MKTAYAAVFGSILLASAAFSGTNTVPGKANLWLAGMPNGSTAVAPASRRGDSAPEQSPEAVTTIAIEGGAAYLFSVSGNANHGHRLPFSGPDGEDLISHYLGGENGIADITAPFASLIGVFLGAEQPNRSPAPPSLDFRNPADRDYPALAPALKQPFFIGDGLTSSGVAQQVIAPAGATRLFLGVMDQFSSYDNDGAFIVQIVQAPAGARVQLVLRPSMNPTSADAVANTAAAIARAANSPTVAAGTSPAPAVSTGPAPNTGPVPNTGATPLTAATTASPELQILTAIELSWPSEANVRYQVEWTPALDSPQWTHFGPVVFGSGASLSVFDSIRTHPHGFYRVKIVQ